MYKLNNNYELFIKYLPNTFLNFHSVKEEKETVRIATFEYSTWYTIVQDKVMRIAYEYISKAQKLGVNIDDFLNNKELDDKDDNEEDLF